ncbi:MAG: hypothetical protein AMJ65_17960, partial [Phycisphaerae bacterium SG8_4]
RINLTDIEKKAYRSTFQDGIWDLFLGSTLLTLAVVALLSNRGMAEGRQMIVLIVLQGAAVAFFIAGKKYVTVPRIGFVKFGRQRKAKVRKSHLVLLGSAVVGAVAFLVASQLIYSTQAGRPRLIDFMPLAWAVNAIAVFSLLAHYLDCPRLHGYGVLFALPVPVDRAIRAFAGVNLSPVAFAVPAIVMLAIGAVLLVSFLRRYPRAAEEADLGKK